MLSTVILGMLVAPLPAPQGWTPLYEIDGEYAGDWFGEAVSRGPDVDHDGVPDPLVGASNANGAAGTDTGKLYVLSGANPNVVLAVYEGAAPYGHLGGRAALAGDVNGDGMEDFMSSESGPFGAAGTVCVYSGATLAVLHEFRGDGPHQYLGTGLGSLGDVDGDGCDDIVLSPQGIWEAGPNGGYIVAYSGRTGAELWRTIAPQQGVRWGSALGTIGDSNGDGITEIAVGAMYDDHGGAKAGAVFLCSGADGAILSQAYGSSTGAQLGQYLAGIGDVNGDGIGDFAAGAPYDDYTGLTNAGSALVFSGVDCSLLYRFDGLQAGDHTGWSAAGGADWDFDGVGDFAVGAPGGASQGTGLPGRVYLISGRSGVLLETLEGTSTGGLFGEWVGVAGDLTGDGSQDLLVGWPFVDPPGKPDAGRVVVYSAPSNFSFSVQGMRPGQLATISAWDCRPGALIRPIYSTKGSDPVWTNYGFVLSLTQPKPLSFWLDTNGTTSAFETVFVPPYVPIGLTVWWQGVEMDQGTFRVSHLVEAVVQP